MGGSRYKIGPKYIMTLITSGLKNTNRMLKDVESSPQDLYARTLARVCISCIYILCINWDKRIYVCVLLCTDKNKAYLKVKVITKNIRLNFRNKMFYISNLMSYKYKYNFLCRLPSQPPLKPK